ncbi:MAG: UxaA family hydrolase [Lentimonas sp.]
MNTTPAFIHLHPDDTIYVLIRALDAGEVLVINGVEYTNEASLSLGHKIAACDMVAGDKVLKYGVSIGLASQPIRCGEHVHLYNLKSEYTNTFTLEKERRYA